ncbi:hypothetical protein QQG55_56050 [Brugia pahangi]
MLAILGDPGYYQKKKPTKRMNHCLQIIDIKELQQKPPAFTKNVLLSGVGRMRYAELRMCVITKKVLISTLDTKGNWKVNGQQFEFLTRYY